VPAGRAVAPGSREGDRAEHGVDDLVPVGHEFGLVPVPAVHAGTAVAGVRRQQFPEHSAAQLQHAGPDHGLGGPQVGRAAQGPGGLRCQVAYLGGPLLRERVGEPPFSPSGTEGASVPATGLASQILSFTSAI